MLYFHITDVDAPNKDSRCNMPSPESFQSIDFVDGTHDILETVCEGSVAGGVLWAVDTRLKFALYRFLQHVDGIKGFEDACRTGPLNRIGIPGRLVEWKTGLDF